MTLKFDGWPWKTIGYLFYATSSFVHHFKAICEFKLELQSGNAQFGSKLAIFCPVWPWNLRDDLKNNNRVPLPCYFKLCASPEMPNLGKNWLFLLQVTLKFERWPWKTIGHLYYATSRFMHHFVGISEFKLNLQSGNAQFWSKSELFVPCDLEIWRMTLKINRAPLLCHFCASFHSHWWTETGVSLKRLNSGQNLFFYPRDLEIWWKTLKSISHHFYAISSFVHHFVVMDEFKLELRSGKAQIGAKFVLTSVTLTFDLDVLRGHHFCQW